MKPVQPNVSVILPTFNRAREIVRSIRSVLDQDYPNLELIVIDDGSTDNSSTVIPQLAAGDSRLRYELCTRQTGGAAARNRGLALAQGEWIAFQDSDDVWLPGKLTRQVAVLTQAQADDPRVQAIYSRYRRSATDGSTSVEPPGERATLSGDLLPALLRRSLIGTPTLVCTRSAIDRSGHFDPQMPRLQDWELAIRMAQQIRFAFVDEILVEAGHSDNGITRGHDDALIQAETRVLQLHRSSMLEAGPDVLAYRLWHLGHLHLMAGQAAAGQSLIAEALTFQPRHRWRALGWLGRVPLAYRTAYAVFSRFGRS